MKRGKALVLPISASASTARSLTHQSGVSGGFDQLRPPSFVLGLIENFDGGAANVLIVVLDEGEHRSTTVGPPILPSASAARVRTHQSLSAITSSRYLTDLEGTDHVQYLDGGAPGVFVLVLEHVRPGT